ncbi:hypothetical protein BJ165DRAFT_165296 [Panaeolus papilionaceus]|nr:hypothetical protein BJ165DRAFT_165296 [Panaeolus papilionaceus]
MLKALLKKDNLNVQEAASDALSIFLKRDQLREVFIDLNHLDILFSMVELGEDSWRIPVLRILDGLIMHSDTREALDQHRPSEKLTRSLLSATPHVRRRIFAFFIHCLKYEELKFLLVDQGLEASLLELFKLQNIGNDFAEEIFFVLFLISDTREHLPTRPMAYLILAPFLTLKQPAHVKLSSRLTWSTTFSKRSPLNSMVALLRIMHIGYCIIF